MSLINKMLQDLDARGSKSTAAQHAKVMAAPAFAARLNMQTLGMVLLGFSIVVAGFMGWRWWSQRVSAPAPGARAASAMQILAVPKPIVLTASAAPAPAPAPAPPAAAPAVVAAVASKPAPSVAPAAASVAAPAVPKTAVPEAEAEVVPKPKSKRAKASVPPESASVSASASAELAASASAATKSSKKKKKKTASASASEAASVEPEKGRDMTPKQRAETEYRNALLVLQEGRSSAALSALEQAVQLDPSHDAARQTLVSLLIESKRTDEAMRQLQIGLTLEPRQPNMAMLLARLQIERGISGVETLNRTLPYAQGNGEYHAFLAGALQREQRHKEAIEQYQAAVRVGPQQGVWQMGLAISLQAEKRLPEAIDAYQRAKAAHNLSPDLQAYVERKLVQLGR